MKRLYVYEKWVQLLNSLYIRRPTAGISPATFTESSALKGERENIYSYCHLSLLHLTFSLRGMKYIDADNQKNRSVWLFSLFLCTLIMLLELTADKFNVLAHKTHWKHQL